MDMRNEVLPPFSNMQTQRELHDWLKRRLNVLGFSNTSEISQPVFDFLHLRTDQNTSDLPSDLVGNDSAQYVKQERMQNDKEQRQILLDNLINLSGQVYPIRMLIDELYSKLKRIQEMDFLDKQRSTRLITDKSILRENGSAYVPFSNSQLESTNNSFRHLRNTHFFNNENRGDRLDLYNRRVEQQCDERIKSIVQKKSAFTIMNPANTQSSIDMPKASTSSESKFIEAPKSFDKSNFILKLMAKEPNITWYKTVMNVEENFLMRNKEIDFNLCDMRTRDIFTNTYVPNTEEDAWTETQMSSFDYIRTKTFIRAFSQNFHHPSPLRHSCLASQESDSPKTEDLLVSDLTHFHPIKDDAEFADGTSFVIDNTVPAVTFSRSESGKLYRPESNTPYFEYHPWKSDGLQLNEIFPLIKFRACKNDQTTQTDFEMNGVTTDLSVTDSVEESPKTNDTTQALNGDNEQYFETIETLDEDSAEKTLDANETSDEDSTEKSSEANEPSNEMTSHTSHENRCSSKTEITGSQSKSKINENLRIDCILDIISDDLEVKEISCEPPICETPTRPVRKCRRRLIFSDPENHSEVPSISSEFTSLPGIHPLPSNSLDSKDEKIQDYENLTLKEIREAFLNSKSWYLSKPWSFDYSSSSEEDLPDQTVDEQWSLPSDYLRHYRCPSSAEQRSLLPTDCPPSVEQRPSLPSNHLPTIEENRASMQFASDEGATFNYASNLNPSYHSLLSLQPESFPDNNMQSSQHPLHNITSPSTSLYDITFSRNMVQLMKERIAWHVSVVKYLNMCKHSSRP